MHPSTTIYRFHFPSTKTQDRLLSIFLLLILQQGILLGLPCHKILPCSHNWFLQSKLFKIDSYSFICLRPPLDIQH